MQRKKGTEAKFLDKKRLFLTYPKWTGYVPTLVEFLKLLEDRFKELELQIENYCICLEDHQDGTPHFHAYIRLLQGSNRRGADLLDLVGNHPNIEPVKSDQAAIKYCKKGDRYITDIEETKQDVKKSKSQRQIICEEIINNNRTPQSLVHEYPSMLYDLEKYIKNTSLFRLLNSKQTPTPKTKGIWIYGKPGSGKTRGVREFYKKLNIAVYAKPQSKWWCGYQGQPVALIDDFDFHGLHHNLKLWADHYAEAGETKGGNVPLLHKYIVITSNKSINELFCYDPLEKMFYTDDDRDAIRRRFVVHELHKGFPFPSLPLDNFDVLPSITDSPATTPGGLASGVSLPSHVIQKLSEIQDSDEDLQ